MNTEDYTKFARKIFAEEKGLIERLGMAAKNLGWSAFRRGSAGRVPYVAQALGVAVTRHNIDY